MPTYSGGVYQYGGAPVSAGIPFGPKSNYFFVDPANGWDGNDGRSIDNALASVQAAYAKCVSGQHDTIFLIAGSTAAQIAASITWSKNFTHLIGVGCELPGMGQRCRIVGSSTVDATSVITVSGQGCIFRNLQFANEGDANAVSAAAVVSGIRNHFQNVYFAGMMHATPAANANGYSLLVSGAENCFDDCVIGVDTIKRTTNRQLKVSGFRNTFRSCHVNSYCETAGSFMVEIDNSVNDMRLTRFVECLFYNYRENWGTAITDCFKMPAAGYTHDVLLQNCMMYGCTGWADNVSHLIHMQAAAATGGGIGIAVNA
jgi:hypothetical protein